MTVVDVDAGVDADAIAVNAGATLKATTTANAMDLVDVDNQDILSSAWPPRLVVGFG